MALIDCSAAIYMPTGWSVRAEDQIEGTVQGSITWKPASVQLHELERQHSGGHAHVDAFRRQLQGKPLLNSSVLRFLLMHQQLVPEGWKEHFTFFWGTVYRNQNNRPCVSYLYYSKRRSAWGAHNWKLDKPTWPRLKSYYALLSDKTS